MARDPQLERLERKLDELKHQYDLYLSGQRRTEPVSLMRETERGVLELMRSPVQSTMVKFQIKTLAQRFRAFQTQIKNLLDLKFQRATSGKERDRAASVIIDAVAVENPNLIAARVRIIAREIAASGAAEVSPALDEKQLSRILLGKARTMLKRDDVVAVRFSLTRACGAPKIKGEIICRTPPCDDTDTPQG